MKTFYVIVRIAFDRNSRGTVANLEELDEMSQRNIPLMNEGSGDPQHLIRYNEIDDEKGIGKY